MNRTKLFSDFNKRITIGTIESVPNKNTGDNDADFVPQFSLWAKVQRRTANQSNTIYGTALEDSLVLAVRHDDRLSKALKVQYSGDVYDIVIHNKDESNNYLLYDYLTVRLFKKKG
ncbi:phage head closure protein [Lactococcus garvieae]|uniref:phage head closure protein n=1 Tax=Lactococcus garvieae TaxID=1363 RepID=UPI0005A63B16|nr:phage head closure protein [Lactococcus garvieae]MDG6191142.1 phage head closure protein [Lactococcus garvieae]QPR48980.1 phage head closure protein [Lactococcus garvieae]